MLQQAITSMCWWWVSFELLVPPAFMAIVRTTVVRITAVWTQWRMMHKLVRVIQIIKFNALFFSVIIASIRCAISLVCSSRRKACLIPIIIVFCNNFLHWFCITRIQNHHETRSSSQTVVSLQHTRQSWNLMHKFALLSKDRSGVQVKV